MNLRTAAAADADAITVVVHRAFAKYVPRMGTRPRPMDRDYHAALADPSVLVLVLDDERTGEIAGSILLHPTASALEIDDLAIDPDHQGKGLGRRLLDAAESHAAALGLPELQLSTNAAMTENLTLYPHLGWTESARTTTEDGFHRVLFTKRTKGV